MVLIRKVYPLYPGVPDKEAEIQQHSTKTLDLLVQRYQRQSKVPGKHWEMTRAKELLCGYNLYLTNAPEEKLKDEDVFFIYGLRWSRLRRETAL